MTPTGLSTYLTSTGPDPPTPEQLAYLQNYVNSFEAALFSPNFTDPTTGYAAYVDVGSLIDYYLVSELVRNQDALIGSTYFYKPRDGKLIFGPLWDEDNALGNTAGWDTGDATGWFLRRTDSTSTKWINRLFQDPAFATAVLRTRIAWIDANIHPTPAPTTP